MFYIYIYIYRMDKQDLLDNLSGQKYVDGYVVNEEKPQFAKIRDKILLGTKFTKGQGNIKDNEVFVQRPTVKEDKTTRKIYVQTSDFEDFEEHKQFQKARRVDLQIQNRLNERLVNQIETSYAPQATTLAELKALQTTRPQLQKELEAVEEYAKTHYLTKEQKAKLKEDVYKKNYNKWKKGIESVQTGTANEKDDITEKEKEEFPRDPRLPPVIPRDQTKEKEDDIKKFGDIINLNNAVGQTQLREIAQVFLNPNNGGFVKILNGDGYKTNRNGVVNINNRLFATLSFLVLLTTSKENLKNVLVNDVFKKDRKYIPQIFFNINAVYKRAFGSSFFKLDYKNTRPVINSRSNGFQTSMQFRVMVDTLFDIFQEIRRRIPRTSINTINAFEEIFIEEMQNRGTINISQTQKVNYIENDLVIFGENIEDKTDTLKTYTKDYAFIYTGRRVNPAFDVDAGNAGGAAGGGN